jgi:hypothetical protein
MNNIFTVSLLMAMTCPHSMSHSAYITAIKHGKHGREHVTLVSIVLKFYKVNMVLCISITTFQFMYITVV